MSDPMTVSRRLVAVFATDVEGYSRLMGADEVGTLKGLTERRAISDPEASTTLLGPYRIGPFPRGNTAIRSRCCCDERGFEDFWR